MIMGETTYVGTWKAMEGLLKTGKTKVIGISNFSKSEVETLLREGSVQQFTEWHRSKGIHNTQFSPLGNQDSFYREVSWSKEHSNVSTIIEDPLLHDVGRKYGKSAAQVTLDKGRSVIPKSVIDWQIKENLAADFKLDSENMMRIDSMDMKLRFNHPSVDYQWRLYSDLEEV
ncbi:hypothetical protein H2201_006453 [Coniosporium apollinis]|uniref:NADP-dependent oxidoreductase domain-containing protein n=1 Tax=Coniosporium apollinis TaxID=61459 RepID=A0ABQ9NMP1_9PEZI|nr:hypothetical protein H2201_006453 [Coniosporium apollinis]